MSPEQMRAEADQSEQLARTVSYAKDKAWLIAKADELRRQAERLEAQARSRPRRPPGGLSIRG